MDEGVSKFKEPNGFWIPNEFIDVHASLLGSRGVYLYCVLVRCVTPKCYPTIYELAALTSLPSKLVSKLLFNLHEFECINDYDMEKIFGNNNSGVEEGGTEDDE